MLRLSLGGGGKPGSNIRRSAVATSSTTTVTFEGPFFRCVYYQDALCRVLFSALGTRKKRNDPEGFCLFVLVGFDPVLLGGRSRLRQYACRKRFLINGPSDDVALADRLREFRTPTHNITQTRYKLQQKLFHQRYCVCFLFLLA
jgi:hypothetical protein